MHGQAPDLLFGQVSSLGSVVAKTSGSLRTKPGNRNRAVLEPEPAEQDTKPEPAELEPKTKLGHFQISKN